MRILAIDTALEACAAGVIAMPDRVLAQESLAMARGHAEALMPLLARVMDQAGIRFDDLDRIAVTVGPGSFTGLRVGIAAARGIALASGKPAVGVSTNATRWPIWADMNGAPDSSSSSRNRAETAVRWAMVRTMA
jgi:tRNA threonylcarbamoyladenosine biosynthesis protein TsaB